MTAPMPETMSPRERMDLKPCPFCGGQPFDRGFRRWECGTCGAQGPAGSKAYATEAWNRRAALASSGDHAGLNRLADEAADFGVPAKVDPAVLKALIAEVAALRSKAVMADVLSEKLERRTFALDEAERKLAEAVDRGDELLKALEWYGEQARLARLIHREGDAGRHALADDGGSRARAFISNYGPRND